MTKMKQNNKIILIILIAIFCISLTPITFQNDTYYTIKIGEYILENGIDMQDPFSWHEDLPYTYPHWLYDLITYLIYSFSGFTGIYIATCILSVILGISIYLVNCKLAKNKNISFFITIGSIYLLREFIAARAQLVTFILFILTIYCIEMFIENKKKRYILGLIIIPILIANLHAAVWPFYFILYLPYVGEYFISVLIEFMQFKKFKIYTLEKRIKKLEKKGKKDKLEVLKEELEILNEQISKIKLKREEKSYKIKIQKDYNIKLLIIIMLIAIFTGLLTPIGNTPYTYLVKTLQGNTTENINEHLAMKIVDYIDRLTVIIIFISILMFTKTKIRLRDLFMFCGLTYLMLSSQRQASMFALICGIILNRLLANSFNIKCLSEIKLTKSNVILLNITICLIIIATLLYFGSLNTKKSFVDENKYPVQASEWILSNLDLENLRMYNEYNYGSYLLFKGIPVFIDSRCDLYTPEFNTKTGKVEDGKNIFLDFLYTFNTSKFYGELIEEYNMTHIMAYKNSKLNMLIENVGGGKFVLLYSDKQFVIYEIAK